MASYLDVYHPQLVLTSDLADQEMVVTVEDVKTQCRIPQEVIEEEGLLESYIRTAQSLVEKHTGYALWTQTRKLFLNGFPCEKIKLYVRPLVSVAVKYYNRSEVLTTVSSSNYYSNLLVTPGWVYPKPNSDWPTDLSDNPQPVQLEIVCGYDDRNQVPHEAKSAIRLLVGHWFRNREAVGRVTEQVKFTYSSLTKALKARGYP